eukprot:7391963-Prymnesium_polylepis.2
MASPPPQAWRASPHSLAAHSGGRLDAGGVYGYGAHWLRNSAAGAPLSLDPQRRGRWQAAGRGLLPASRNTLTRRASPPLRGGSPPWAAAAESQAPPAPTRARDAVVGGDEHKVGRARAELAKGARLAGGRERADLVGEHGGALYTRTRGGSSPWRCEARLAVPTLKPHGDEVPSEGCGVAGRALGFAGRRRRRARESGEREKECGGRRPLRTDESRGVSSAPAHVSSRVSSSSTVKVMFRHTTKLLLPRTSSREAARCSLSEEQASAKARLVARGRHKHVWSSLRPSWRIATPLSSSAEAPIAASGSDLCTRIILIMKKMPTTSTANTLKARRRMVNPSPPSLGESESHASAALWLARSWASQ